MLYSQKTSVILLSLIELLERFSYYGMRSIIVLFAINQLQISDQEALKLYGTFSLWIFIIPFPAGIISDAFLKQKQAVFIGGILSLIGYALLITEQMYPVGIGLILIVLGTGFVRPNLVVLVGRLFKKTDKNRGFGFMFYYFMINIGAFLSALLVGYLADFYGYKYGFAVTAIATFVYFFIFYFTKDHIQLIEQNIEEEYIENDKLEHTILDFELTQTKKFNPNQTFLIFILIFIITFFWQIFEVIGINIQNVLPEPDLSSSDSYYMSLNRYSFQLYNSIFLVLVTCLFYFAWYLSGLGSTILKIAFSMLLMGISAQLVSTYLMESNNNLISMIGLTAIIYTVAEILISPFVLSYITRLSDIRYSSTMIGAFMLITGVGSKVLGYFYDNLTSPKLITAFSIIAILIGLLLLFFRKKLLKMSGGLD